MSTQRSVSTPTVTADLTLNTDFAQVEADQQVINLTRFPTFFPEKREFFLESSGLFDIGTAERVQLFYSRRLGLDSTGAAGADSRREPESTANKVPGPSDCSTFARAGARTRTTSRCASAATSSIDRRLPAMFVDRSAPGGVSERGGGFDLDFPLVVRGHNVEPHVWLMGTQTAAAAGTPLAWRVSTDYPNDLFDNFVSLYRIDSGFAPTMGFVRRSGVWETTGHVDYMPRPGILGIRRLDLTPIPSWDIIADRTRGDLSRPSTWQTADFEWHAFAGELQSGDQFEVNVQRDLDAPATSFDVFRDITIVPGRYWWTSANVQYQTSPGRPWSAGAVLSSGQFYDGHSTAVEWSGTYRGGGHFILTAGYSATAARLSAGRFTATQLTSRFEYAFTTRIDVLGFAQFQNEDRRTDFNVRFHWTPTIGDDVYVVWNSGFTTDPEGAVAVSQSRGTFASAEWGVGREGHAPHGVVRRINKPTPDVRPGL